MFVVTHHTMLRADGYVVPAGSHLLVLREFTVQHGERRLCLGDETGRVHLTSVRPDAVEIHGRRACS